MTDNFFVNLKENRSLALRFEESDLDVLILISIAAIQYNICSQYLMLSPINKRSIIELIMRARCNPNAGGVTIESFASMK